MHEERFSSYKNFRRIHLSVFRHRLVKNDFPGPKSFRGFRETGPGSVISQMLKISLVRNRSYENDSDLHEND